MLRADTYVFSSAVPPSLVVELPRTQGRRHDNEDRMETWRKESEPTQAGRACIRFSKAFDTTPRNILYDELARFGFDRVTIDCLKDIYRKVKLRVKVNGLLSTGRILADRGFPQGRPASTINWNALYDTPLDALCRSGLAFKVTSRYFMIYVFADDTNILSNHPGRLHARINYCRVLVSRVEMKANVKKSIAWVVS